VRRALITGADGFVGQWLAKALLAQGWQVTGTAFKALPPRGTLSAEEREAIRWEVGDLTAARDLGPMRSLVERASPDAIFHLAGMSYVPTVGDDPVWALETNVGVGIRLLEAVRLWHEATGAHPSILVVGSAEQYGRQPAELMPLSESVLCQPRTFYGATKQAQEDFALAAARAHGLHIVTTRSFNHCGPGHAPIFLLPALVQRVLAAKQTGAATLPIGNTDSVRDYLHVSDVIAAYLALVDRGQPGESYNVCSGTGVTAGEVAALVIARAQVELRVEQDPVLLRPADVPMLVGNNHKIRAHTGWAPTRTLADIIDDHLYAAS
jgi:GDP-4-dehydro-6-deoxy-D-mannose reductase